MSNSELQALADRLDQVLVVLERLCPAPPPPADLDEVDAFVWSAPGQRLLPVARVNRVDVALLKAIDRGKRLLVDNTRRFADGFSANNVLLWGARGMGKSSLVKASHATVNDGREAPCDRLKLIEIHREDIESLPQLMSGLRGDRRRFIIFCDDLSFDADDTSYKSLKAVLDGGIEGRPDNVLFYATSNRRHLVPRDMIDNERATAINPGDAIEEKVSLSDRFGLWIGFHNASQDDYLEMVNGYVDHFGLEVEPNALRREALEWSMTRGARSGRVAWQFVQDLAGRLGTALGEKGDSRSHVAGMTR